VNFNTLKGLARLVAGSFLENLWQTGDDHVYDYVYDLGGGLLVLLDHGTRAPSTGSALRSSTAPRRMLAAPSSHPTGSL
jgi:hypothetical protein